MFTTRPMRVIRSAWPHLVASGTGRVVNIASLSGKRVRNDNLAYAMSKFAVMALTQEVRRLGFDHGKRRGAAGQLPARGHAVKLHRLRDTDRPRLTLTLDGQTIEAQWGDTLLTALLAGGAGFLRRSEFGDDA